MVMVLTRTSSSESNGTTATTGPIKWKRELTSPYNFLILLKRPSHGKLKLAKSCCRENFEKLTNSFLHTSNSCQITNTVICNMAVFLSVVALTYSSETEEKRRNRKRWRNRKVWTKPSLSARSSVLFYSCLSRLKMKRPKQPDSFEPLR